MQLIIALLVIFIPLAAYYYWLLFRKEGGQPAQYLGQNWEVTAQAFSEKNGASGYYLHFIMDFPHHNVHLDFHRESSWTEMLKGLSIARECQTGDRNFDDLVYINTDSRTIHNLLKSEGAIRAVIQELLNHNEISKIQIKNGKISLHMKTYRTDLSFKRSFMKKMKSEDLKLFLQDFSAVSDRLLKLKNLLLDKWGTDPINWDQIGFRRGLKLTLIGIGLMLAGMALYYHSFFSGNLGEIHQGMTFFAWGLIPTLALFFALMIGGLINMKGSAWAPHFLFPFLFLMIIAAPAWSYSVFKFLNHRGSGPEQILSMDIHSNKIEVRKSKRSRRQVCHTVSTDPLDTYRTAGSDLAPSACEIIDQIRTRGEKPQFQYDMHKGRLGFHWYTERKLVNTGN